MKKNQKKKWIALLVAGLLNCSLIVNDAGLAQAVKQTTIAEEFSGDEADIQSDADHAADDSDIYAGGKTEDLDTSTESDKKAEDLRDEEDAQDIQSYDSVQNSDADQGDEIRSEENGADEAVGRSGNGETDTTNEAVSRSGNGETDTTNEAAGQSDREETNLTNDSEGKGDTDSGDATELGEQQDVLDVTEDDSEPASEIVDLDETSETEASVEDVAIEDEQSEGADATNASSLYSVDGALVNPQADGKPLVLVFFKTTCLNCRSVLKNLRKYTIDTDAVDIIAAEMSDASQSDVKTFSEEYGSSGVTFCYGASDLASSFIADYSADGSVTTPFIVYENAEGDIAGYSTGEVDLLEKIDEKLGIFPVKNTYKILFDGNGAKSGSMEDMVCTRKVLYTLNANAFQRTGYQFSAWNTKSDGSGTSYKDKAKVLDIVGSDTSENEIRLYAIWKANEYTISFLGNGATSGSMSAQKGCKYDQSIALKANAFKRKGYAFTGWNTKSNGKGTTYKNKATVKNLSAKAGAQVSLYAQWQKQKYTITYKLSNGKNNKGNPAYYEITSATITLKNPSRKGYAFKGWYTDSKFKKKATGIKKGSTGNKTFYAKWAANTYYVVFHGNGSNSGKMSKKYTCKYDATLTLPKNVFKKTGYSFQGWNTKKNGKGTACKNKAKVKNLSAKSGSTVTLYAQWKAISYKISFKANGGTGTMSDLSCTYGKTYKIPACTFVKNKYSFTKWNTKANGKGTSYAKGASIKNLTTKNGQTITLYARWELHFDKISLGAKSRSKNEIKKFIASHPVSTNDTYSKNPSVSGTIAAGKLSSNTLKSALNAVNVYRYIAGLNADITLDENYSDYASKATLVNYLNDDMSHTPLRPGVLSSSAYDSLYEDAYYGASHSNLAWASWNMPLKNAVDLWMDDTDAYNIDRVGHRRWLLFSRLAKIGFGKTGGHTAVFVIGESRSSSPASWTWPARNTPVGYFDDETAWSLTMGEYVDSSKVQVAVKRDSDGKTWKFSSKSSNGYFGVDNGGYGDVGCIVFQPTSISCSAGQTYTVTVHFYDSMEVLEYKVNFY